jgi:DNA-binding GntR family transcriptional regulator
MGMRKGSFHGQDALDIRQGLRRETLVDRICEILEEEILNGALGPGSKLSEARVAVRFGVSRIPAREALNRLEDMGLVRKTHLSREVAEFSLHEFREIYELKNVIEAFGAMKGSLAATKEDLAEIQLVLDEMVRCSRSGNLRELARINARFHDLLVFSSRHGEIIRSYSSLVKRVRWAALSHSLPGRPAQSTDEHMAIFDAFKRRDGQRVRMLLESHLNASMERTLGRMAKRDDGKTRKGRSGG